MTEEQKNELLKQANMYLKEYYLCAQMGSKAVVLDGLESLNKLILDIQKALG